MTAVFVHGVPETTHVWGKVRAELDDVQSVALALPGFGVPVPAGFGATMDEYAEWLVGELEALGEPLDLVGHDWGGLLTGRLVSIRPDLVRSWVSDAVGGFDDQWEWHQIAQVWQTPGEGEEFFRVQRELAEADQLPLFTAMGVPEDDARAMVRAGNPTMDDCILKLYRSAVDVRTQWGPALGHVPAPGLVLIPSDDPVNVPDAARRVAERSGARVEVLEGVGHWWPYEAPERAAAVLREFWASV
ncbi:MAG TPA: alpha/beta hydrolase [Acidimicrobiia bacterium]